MPDSVRHSCSVIVSQATDEKFDLLRDPLSPIEVIPKEEKFLLIDGKTLLVVRQVRDIEKRLSVWKDRITVVNSIDDLNGRHLTVRPSVICLTELDKPVFSDTMTSDRIAALPGLFSQSSNVLWITAGRLSKDSIVNIVVGIGRALMTELPHITLWLINIYSIAMLDPGKIVKAFLRLSLMVSHEY